MSANTDIYDLDSYDYFLPEELIAQEPVIPRDSCRLMVVDRAKDKVFHVIFRDIIKSLEEGDLLVLNDTKVIKARLIARKPTGARIELFLLKPNIDGTWEALLKPAKKVKVPSILQIDDVKVNVLERKGKIFRVSFENMTFENVMEFLDRKGIMPLPPYIKDGNSISPEMYQTVFASKAGSVAAPTAGLHFTEELLNTIKNMGVNIAYITLHVGLGTFEPVREKDIRKHKIHSEYLEVSEDTVKAIKETKAKGKRVIAVGTTVVRALETAAQSGELTSFYGESNLFIYPGYQFKVVDSLITNFHLPKSTLLMLVSAFYDREKILKLYEEAVRLKYRFFSFGDAMFLI